MSYCIEEAPSPAGRLRFSTIAGIAGGVQAENLSRLHDASASLLTVSPFALGAAYRELPQHGSQPLDLAPEFGDCEPRGHGPT